MLTFPQLKSGAISQVPLVKVRASRTITNRLDDGTFIALSDANGGLVTWELAYSGVTDSEVAVFKQFFEGCEGRLQSFIFLDPLANLISFSENLSGAAWLVPGLLTATAGIADPLGTTRATRLTNGGAAALSLSQSVGIPGNATICFSAYLRAASATPVTLTRSDGSNVDSVTVQAQSGWARFSRTSAFASSQAALCTWSVQIPSGASVDVFGLQLEAQPMAGAYKVAAGAGGVYPSARLASDSLDFVATSPGLTSFRIDVVGKAH